MASDTGVIFADTDPTLVDKIAGDPSLLRSKSIARDLKGIDPASLAPLMRSIAADSAVDWDLRARAITYLGREEDGPARAGFAAQFDPLIVAARPWGPQTFEILAGWASRSRVGETTAGPLLQPTPERSVDEILKTLAGHPIHEYLAYLNEYGVQFKNDTIEALGETDDQLTRQFLCWWVGEHRPPGMASFLLDQITSTRSSSYRSQVDRVFVALFTAGIGELIRSAVPTPRWLKDDATPKGLALESLASYFPPGRSIEDREVVSTLLEAAQANAPGKDRGQWALAVDILYFLEDREVSFAGGTDRIAADLVRQVLHKRGPLEPFIAVADLNRTSDLVFPTLTAKEQERVWVVASKTLDAAFLKAVIDFLPDTKQRETLEKRLVDLGPQAARGTLRIVRCWGADIETPGDWALAVSALGLTESIGDVEGVLNTSWPDDAVQALIHFGEPGAPALARFLTDPDARHIDRHLREKAIESCALNLPEDEWESLLADLDADFAAAAAGL